MPRHRFTPEQFTPTKWATAEDKVRFANHFVRFVESDFAEASFPRWFYERLCNIFGHIAHYNRQGFFDEFFRSVPGKLRFLRTCLLSPPVGDPAWTWSDVERWLQSWMATEHLVQTWVIRAQVECEISEREVALRLLAKYPDLLEEARRAA
jgi:hypothetical protein